METSALGKDAQAAMKYHNKKLNVMASSLTASKKKIIIAN